MKLLTTIAAVLISISAFSQDYIEYDNGTFEATQYKNNEKNGLSYVYEGSDYFYGEMRNDRADGLGVLVTGNNYKQGLVFEGNLVEELEFCKKLFGDYYTNPKSEGCTGNDNVIEFTEFIMNIYEGIGDRWLEEYYKKERIKLD